MATLVDKKTRDLFYAFDKPIEYKGLKFYPVKMENYLEFAMLSQCLLLEKNSVSDVKIISMTYLEYLFFLNTKENRLVLMMDALLRLTMNVKDDEDFKIKYWINNNNKPVFTINEKQYTSIDFDNIKKIIAEQNLLELPNEMIQKDVRIEMEKVRKYKMKVRGEIPPTLEDQIISLSVYTGWTVDVVLGLTIRKFIQSIRRANHIFYQQIYTQASMSGMVDFKGKKIVQSWMGGISEQDDSMMELKALENKANMNEAKENARK